MARFNRTLKTRSWTYFTAHQTDKYIDILDKLTDAYNHSYHRTIGMRPVDVKKKDEPALFDKMFGEARASRKRKPAPPVQPGEMVRVSKLKGQFEKGYMPNWSQEHFIVDKVNSSTQRRVYKLKDYANEDISFTWYDQEVQPIKKNLYLIEKVLRKWKMTRGEQELFVKWKGWPNKFNSWIKDTDFHDIQKTK